ncbi:MAG TPA: tRNA 2-thiouridine(34) synthase MnmA [Acidimicrobiales bacterium]|nr:tRNA 2-thiouridine(34) synthase MnmA [Acidimicrobiales bacterium]
MRVLVAMSGGVDSSVAAALLVDAGHDVVGATMKLWGGPSDTGCCSVADVEDARRVAQQLGIDHHVFNFTDSFDADVVVPYVADHAAGRTPNPCVECNRSLKFDRFLRRADALGFDAIATGHHARIDGDPACGWSLGRGRDRDKDQSYVLHMLGQDQLGRTLLPVGAMTKDEVRAVAAAAGLRTAAKPDSQDVCFIASGAGRSAFLGERIALHPGRVVDTDGRHVGDVEAVELVTVGQRKGLGPVGAGVPRYALAVDVASATVTVGSPDELLVTATAVTAWTWTADAAAIGTVVEAQTSAHGEPRPAVFTGGGVEWSRPAKRVAPGQSVVLYDGDRVLGGGRAA